MCEDDIWNNSNISILYGHIIFENIIVVYINTIIW